MFNPRSLTAIFLSTCSFVSHSNSTEQQNKVFRSFWHPTYQGKRLDYCTLDGKACGKVVANRYCRMLGYDYSSQSVIAYHIDLTQHISSSASCKGWQCNGFMNIICVSQFSHRPPKPYHYREKQFVDPQFNQYRVDWCYDQKGGCGRRAANSFCSHVGFMKAKQFTKETHVGITQTIGSQELCFGKQCDGFKTIVCYR